jgi:gluconate 5-dehydrogenase
MSLGLFGLDGRCALITGSSQGIGLAIAHGLASAGADIIINGRDRKKLERVASA